MAACTTSWVISADGFAGSVGLGGKAWLESLRCMAFSGVGKAFSRRRDSINAVSMAMAFMS